MARITIYKKSVLANFVNIIGYILMYAGVILLLTEGEIFGGVFCALLGPLLSCVAIQINADKVFANWWKNVGAEREQGIKNSVSYAVEIYNINPCKRTLDKIRTINEEAADYITMNLKAGKANGKENKGVYIFLVIYIVAVIGMAIFGIVQNRNVDNNHAMLCGTWIMDVSESEETRVAILQRLDFDQEEIALVKDVPMTMAYNVTFTKTQFSFGLSDVKTEEHMARFFNEVFGRLYLGREKLSELYGMDMQEMSLADFLHLYAQMYEKESYKELIADFSRIYNNRGKGEFGTYEIKTDKLLLRGQEIEGKLGYEVYDDKLILIYENKTEEYVKSME